MDLKESAEEALTGIDRWIEFFQDPDKWILLGLKVLGLLVFLLFLYIVMRILTKMVERVFNLRRISEHDEVARRQNETLMILTQNTVRYIVGIIAILTVLAQFGLNITGLIASAGVAGLAISFGAQNLVKDVITGAFIIFESQYKNGDYVRLNDQVEGVVMEVGVRTTKLRGLNGQVTIIPNGQILLVTNYSLENGMAVVDIDVAYEEDMEKVEEALRDIAVQVEQAYPETFLAPIVLVGVQMLGPSSVKYRLMAEVPPSQHLAAGRILHRHLKDGLAERGIEIPYPRTVMISATPSGTQDGGEANSGK